MSIFYHNQLTICPQFIAKSGNSADRTVTTAKGTMKLNVLVEEQKTTHKKIKTKNPSRRRIFRFST
jgi:hypothetical protein